MIDPFESYKLYNALKLHFETNYDAVKYNFKSNVTPQSFFKRKDKYFFAKLAMKYNGQLKDFYISQFINTEKYIGDMMDKPAEENYARYKRIKESIHRVFSVDINILNEQEKQFDSLFKSENGQVPLVVKLWMQEEISLETIVILNSIFGFIDRESQNISDTIMWPDMKRIIEKYTPFVYYNRNKCMKLLTNVFI
ncbi:MAG: hypothetical protein CMQ15_01560 [Gammaproteobacteria bacterium]|jgi:hypothetical protein|nr:hypothetical protein [Gammaproteobacteria bacterium]|tara:strand:+ start:198 stop:782 length:585 start_codon:yes stop_codon:yes gene_type:complete